MELTPNCDLQKFLLKIKDAADPGFLNFLCGCDVEALSAFDMETIFLELAKKMDIVSPASLEVSTLLECLICDRIGRVLSLTACNNLLFCLRKMSYSPLSKLKKKAYDISSNLLKLHPLLRQEMINKFENLNLDAIDLDLFLKNMNDSQICSLLPLFNRRVVGAFVNNVTSQEGAIYYKHLIRCYEFDRFKMEIWPIYFPYLCAVQKGEFYQSLLKYWIPISVSRYESMFYVFIREKNIDQRIKSNTLLNIRKKGFDSSMFHDDAVQYLSNPETRQIALETICSNKKLRSYPSPLECDTVLLYIKDFSEVEFPATVIKILKRFLSQIFLLCHVDNTVDDLYNGFFEELLNWCKSDITSSCSELCAQLLTGLLDIATGTSEDLVLSYRCPDLHQYKTNEYYQRKMKSIVEKQFFDGCTILKIENMFSDEPVYRPSLTVLAQKYYLSHFQLKSLNFKPFHLLKRLSKSESLRSSDSMRAYSRVIINTNNVLEISLLLEMIEATFKVNRFKAVLLLDMAIEGISVVDGSIIKFVILKSFSLLEDDCKTLCFRNLDKQDVKIYEAFINNVLLLLDLTIEKQNWLQEEKFFISQVLVSIIQKSNLKRPVQQAAKSLLFVLRSIPENTEGNNFKRNFLKTCLEFHTSDGNIRKNPETRLVIYAICKSSPWIFLPVTFTNLFLYISHPNVSNSGLAAALNTLEILVSDNSLYAQTLAYMVDVITYSFNAISDRKDFAVRNAAIQLLKAIINRFYGVTLNDGSRPKNIDHIFTLFPSLVDYFFQILNQKPRLDNAVYVLQFFLESQVHYIDSLSRNEIERFVPVIQKIALDKSTVLNSIAAKIYFLLVKGDALPDVVLKCVAEALDIYPTNVITSFMDTRLKMEPMDSNRREELLFQYLEKFLCEREAQKNNFQGNLLNEETNLSKFPKQGIDFDHEKSIWLSSCMIFFISKLSTQQLPSILERVLSYPLPDSCHCKILNVLKQKFTNNFDPSLTSVLVMRMVELFHFQTLLTEQYANTILYFYDLSDELNWIQTVLQKIRNDIETKSIYKLFIYVLILTRNTSGQDIDFFHRSMNIFKTVSIQDSPKLIILAIVLPRVFENFIDFLDFFKVMFTVLMNSEAAVRLSPFVLKLSGSTEKINCNPKSCITKILKFDFLYRFLKDANRVLTFLSDIYKSLKTLPDSQKESLSLLSVEENYSVPRAYVQGIVQTEINQILSGSGTHDGLI